MKVFQSRIYEGTIASTPAVVIDRCIDSVARWCAEMGYEHCVITEPMNWWMSPLARPESVPYLETLAQLSGDCLKLDADMFVWGTPEIIECEVGVANIHSRELPVWGVVDTPSVYAIQLKADWAESLSSFIEENHWIVQDPLLQRTFESLSLGQRGAPFSLSAWWLQYAKPHSVELPAWYGLEISQDALHPDSIVHIRGHNKALQLDYLDHMMSLWDRDRALFDRMNQWATIAPNMRSPT